MIFEPYEYQKYTIEYIKSHPVTAAFLDCGLGKTVISLSALKDLIDAGEVKKALVIAPLRVARDVWPAETEKWEHLKELKISVILGTPKQREEALKAEAQIYVINRDNLSWLVSQKWPIYMFDTVVLDELSSFKNMRAARTRAAYRLCREAKRVIGLTGTPASNGLMDLWAEYAVMDGGYQLKYFNPVFGYQGKIVDWKPREGSEEKIYEAISDITISMKAMDHLQMPEKVVTDYVVRLSEKEKALYEKLTAEMSLNLKGGEITAKNAMALGTKLIQMSNGIVYGVDGTPVHIHDHKLEALEDLLEAANGKPVLVVYNYRHDLMRIEAMLRDKGIRFAALDSKESIRAWNRGELAVGLINPQSAGHGLNLQEGGSRVIWYSPVVIQHILTEGTIDEKIRAVLGKKDKTQTALIDAVKAELCPLPVKDLQGAFKGVIPGDER